MLERNLRSGARFIMMVYDGWLRTGAETYLANLDKLAQGVTSVRA
jgi:hypothetical protein